MEKKVGNRSSEFHPEVRRVRREGSYIYEEFLPTGGTDVKVYTVGTEYAHAEARKSPVVDGVVMRNPDGKEVRYPVLLTPTEKQITREVCMAFSQSVCGFDLLRCEGRSYVCDINGWSFVKNSYKYDLVHNPHLNLEGLDEVIRVSEVHKTCLTYHNPNNSRLIQCSVGKKYIWPGKCRYNLFRDLLF